MTRGKRLDYITQELIDMAFKEAIFLWRMARNAKKHGCSEELVADIREEAFWCYKVAKAYPDRLIHWGREYDMRYAFKIK